MKHSISGWVTHTSYPWNDGKFTVGFSEAAINAPFPGNEYTVGVSTLTFEVDVPDNFDPTPAKVAALQATVTKIKAAAFEEVQKIEETIQNLLAIGYTPSATEAEVPGNNPNPSIADDCDDIPF